MIVSEMIFRYLGNGRDKVARHCYFDYFKKLTARGFYHRIRNVLDKNIIDAIFDIISQTSSNILFKFDTNSDIYKTHLITLIESNYFNTL